MKTLADWQKEFKSPSPDLKQKLKSIYGNFPLLIKERISSFSKLLSKTSSLWEKERRIILIRIPGRINLMGVHIEHRGGYVNYLTIQREIIMVASPRKDSKIRGFNVDRKFPPFSFLPGELLPLKKRGNWLKFISASKIIPGDWANYIKGPVLRLQDFVKKELSGMDLVVSGNIPRDSGLSSSSALVVGASLAYITLNKLRISKENLVKLCGEAEWYVGTRGGAGDHAAMLFGKKGYVSHLRFFPFTVEKVPLPSDYTIVICNSLKKAPKSKGVREAYNSTITSYEMALKLIKKNYPLLSKKIKYLRDVNPENLKVNEEKIYEILRSLPLSTKDGYRLRGVALFGLSECARGSITAELLREGKMRELGKLMFISHNGDRLVSFDKNGKKCLYKKEVTDKYLKQLCRGLKNNRKESQIIFQPGDFRCSCKELDELVDISKRIPGVIGAGLTGAGFGGTVLVLIRNKDVRNFLREIKKKYYQAKGLPFAAEVCIPTEGAGILN